MGMRLTIPARHLFPICEGFFVWAPSCNTPKGGRYTLAATSSIVLFLPSSIALIRPGGYGFSHVTEEFQKANKAPARPPDSALHSCARWRK